jgi:hypothetical protein
MNIMIILVDRESAGAGGELGSVRGNRADSERTNGIGGFGASQVAVQCPCRRARALDEVRRASRSAD